MRQGFQNGQEFFLEGEAGRQNPIVINLRQKVAGVQRRSAFERIAFGACGEAFELPDVHGQRGVFGKPDAFRVHFQPIRAEGLAQAIQRVGKIAAHAFGRRVRGK